MHIVRASVVSHVPFFHSVTQRSVSRAANRCYLSHCISCLFQQTHTCLCPINTSSQSRELWNWRYCNAFRSQAYEISYKLYLKQYKGNNTSQWMEWLSPLASEEVRCKSTLSLHPSKLYDSVAYLGILFGGWGSTNSVEHRRQRERGTGSGSALVI
jgi:hypothetical protein